MGRKRITKEFEVADLGKNPFTQENFAIHVRTITTKKRIYESDVYDEEIKQSATVVEIKTNHHVEAETYTKVFTRSAYRLHIMALSSRAKDLYLWLIYEVENGDDHLVLNKKRYMEEASVSTTTLKGAIQDLHRMLILSPTVVENVYWINPLFFFKGSRIEKYKDKLNKE
jgi:hypothetical protein